MTQKKSKVYFPGLDALRFFAAFSVIIGHIELLKSQLGYQNNNDLFTKINFGGLGVYFFFVLSGFLITYLLFEELERTKTIALKKFYLRRVLRIWPLYYLIAFLGFFIFPHFEILHIPWLQSFFEENFYINIVLFFVMLPNLALAFMPAMPHIGQLWSIGIEEQFYLVWPILIKKAKNKLRLIFVGIILIILIKTIYVLSLKIGVLPSNSWSLGVKKALGMSKFECMLIGALGAYFLKYKRNEYLEFIYNKWILGVSLLLLPFLSYLMYAYADDLIHIPYSFLFLIIIMNISSNSKSFLKLEHPVFSFLGKISYGLYMYHMVLIVVIINSRFLDGFQNTIWFNVFLYVLTLIASIIAASLSYYGIEKQFLKLKKSFTVVQSGGN